MTLRLPHAKHSKYRPYAFTEQGVAMLSAVLRSPTAVRVSIEIVRAFVRLRQLLATHEDLRHKLEALERKLSDHDDRFTLVFDAGCHAFDAVRAGYLLREPSNLNAAPPAISASKACLRGAPFRALK